MKKIHDGNYWYIIDEKPSFQKINHFYAQKQYGRINNTYCIRKIVSNFSHNILFDHEKEGYYPININYISELYEIKDTNNKNLNLINRKEKIKRLLNNE